jgi:hypothetical protein
MERKHLHLLNQREGLLVPFLDCDFRFLPARAFLQREIVKRRFPLFFPLTPVGKKLMRYQQLERDFYAHQQRSTDPADY